MMITLSLLISCSNSDEPIEKPIKIEEEVQDVEEEEDGE